jgi:hypothetical protein
MCSAVFLDQSGKPDAAMPFAPMALDVEQVELALQLGQGD